MLLGQTQGIEFVSSEYLKGVESSDKAVRAWRDFLKELGVLDIPRLWYYSGDFQLSEHPQKDDSMQWAAYSGFLHQVGIEAEPRAWQLQCDESRHRINGSSYVNGLDNALRSGDQERLRGFLCLIDRRFSYYEEHLNAIYSYRYHSWNPRTVPSYWLWSVQTTPCIPTTKGLRRPSEVYLPKDEVKAVLGDFVPYLDCELTNQKFLRALGVHNKPSVADASSYLVHCRDTGVKDVAIYAHLYRVLGESPESARQALAMLPDDLIFAPEGANWWQPAGGYWEDASRFFGTDKCYLRKHYTADTYAAVLNLGVKASPESEDLADYLAYLPANTTAVTLGLKQTGWQIYLALEEALKVAGDEDWAQELSEVSLLTEKGVFEQSPFVGDDRTLYELFRDDLPFLWLPESWKRVGTLLSKIGLPLISQTVDISIDVGSPVDSEVEQRAKGLIEVNLRFIQTLLEHKYPDRDFSEEVSLLGAIPIHCVSAVTVEYSLRDGALGSKRPKIPPSAVFDGKKGCIWVVNLEAKNLSLAVTAALGEVGNEIRSEVMQLFGALSEKEKLDLWTLLNIPVPEEIAPLPQEELALPELPAVATDERGISEKQDKGREEVEPKDEEEPAKPVFIMRPEVASPNLGQAGKAEQVRWEPECEPNQAEAQVVTSYKLVKRSPTIHEPHILGNEVPDIIHNDMEKPGEPDITINKDLGKIGRWGEEYAIHCIRKTMTAKYVNGEVEDTANGFSICLSGRKIVEVVWPNQSAELGEHYDIKLVENDEVHFIEVKTTETQDKDWFPMSTPQWDFAREMGDKFHIYRIYGAGETEPPPPVDIINPYKQWADGYLTAYPINIRL